MNNFYDNENTEALQMTRHEYEQARRDFLEKKEELFQQKGKGIYSPVIGKYVTLSCLMLSKPPITDTSPIDEIKLFHEIIDVISKVTETGMMLTPERIWFGLGLSESEFFEAKNNPFDWRSRILTWIWLICDSIAMQNVNLGNASLDVRAWIDRTRTRGEFLPATEKVQIAVSSTIIENEQLKGREAAERLLGKNFDKLLMEG